MPKGDAAKWKIDPKKLGKRAHTKLALRLEDDNLKAIWDERARPASERRVKNLKEFMRLPTFKTGTASSKFERGEKALYNPYKRTAARKTKRSAR